MYSEEEKWRQYELFEDGKNMSDAEVSKLAHGQDISRDDRIRYIGYCVGRSCAELTESLIWFIEHDPDSLALSIAAMEASFEPNDCARLKQVWLQELARDAFSPYALSNAAEFFSRNGEAQLAEMCWIKASLLEPANELWKFKLMKAAQRKQARA